LGTIPSLQTSESLLVGELWICHTTVRLHHVNPQPHAVVDFCCSGNFAGARNPILPPAKHELVVLEPGVAFP